MFWEPRKILLLGMSQKIEKLFEVYGALRRLLWGAQYFFDKNLSFVQNILLTNSYRLIQMKFTSMVIILFDQIVQWTIEKGCYSETPLISILSMYGNSGSNSHHLACPISHSSSSGW